MSRNYKSKETVLVITVGFLLLYFLFKRVIFLNIALIVGLAGIFSFYLSEKIDWLWNKLSAILGTISNGILLTLVFFLVLTPVGLIRRLRRKGGMTYFDREKTSNFSDREHSFAKKDLENTW
jgi:hypothetical protein